MRIALVGSRGYWGSKIDRVLRELGHDVVAEIGRRNADELGCVEADAAIIASPAETHYALAMTAMNAEMDVLVEKPMALSADHAREMQRFAEENDLVLSVDATFLHTAAFGYLNMIDEPLCGYRSLRLAPPSLHVSTPASWDLVVHDLSILHGLGALHGAKSAIGLETGENATAVVEMDRWGALITASREWPTKVRSIVLEFPRATYLWELDGLRLLTGRRELEIVAQEREEPLRTVINDFEGRCLGRDITGVTDGAQGAAVCEWLETIYGPGYA